MDKIPELVIRRREGLLKLFKTGHLGRSLLQLQRRLLVGFLDPGGLCLHGPDNQKVSNQIQSDSSESDGFENPGYFLAAVSLHTCYQLLRGGTGDRYFAVQTNATCSGPPSLPP